jgi:regulator of sirC expression with transglutaminase-like and TPR domain
VSPLSGITSQALAWACAALLLLALGLGARLWWVSADRADVRRDLGTATRNHAACLAANAGWERALDQVQGALLTCTRERDEIRARGHESLARAAGRESDLKRELAAWRTASTAAEALPACRAVLDLELCSELGDY